MKFLLCDASVRERVSNLQSCTLSESSSSSWLPWEFSRERKAATAFYLLPAGFLAMYLLARLCVVTTGVLAVATEAAVSQPGKHNSGSDRSWVFDDGFCPYISMLQGALHSNESVARAELRRRLSTIPESVITSQCGLPTALMSSIDNYVQTQAPCTNNTGQPFPFRPWQDCLEGPVAAPKSHTVLWSNDDVQVLFVAVPTMTREPYHVHSDLSLMFVNKDGDNGEGQRYYDEANTVVWEQPPHAPNASAPLQVQFMAPEWFHSIQNLGGLNGSLASGSGYGAYRFMLRGTVSANVSKCLSVPNSL